MVFFISKPELQSLALSGTRRGQRRLHRYETTHTEILTSDAFGSRDQSSRV